MDVLPCLLELNQSSLQSLVLRRREGLKGSGEADSLFTFAEYLISNRRSRQS